MPNLSPPKIQKPQPEISVDSLGRCCVGPLPLVPPRFLSLNDFIAAHNLEKVSPECISTAVAPLQSLYRHSRLLGSHAEGTDAIKALHRYVVHVQKRHRLEKAEDKSKEKKINDFKVGPRVETIEFLRRLDIMLEYAERILYPKTETNGECNALVFFGSFLRGRVPECCKRTYDSMGQDIDMYLFTKGATDYGKSFDANYNEVDRRAAKHFDSDTRIDGKRNAFRYQAGTLVYPFHGMGPDMRDSKDPHLLRLLVRAPILVFMKGSETGSFSCFFSGYMNPKLFDKSVKV